MSAEFDPKERLIRIMGTFDLATGHADTWEDLLESLNLELHEVLDHYREAVKNKTCKTHPDAPHGFLRTASHNADRYVCECEHWEEPK